MRKIFFVSLLAVTVMCHLSVFTPTLTMMTQKTAECLFKAKYEMPVVRVFTNTGKLDPYGEANLKILHIVGFKNVAVVMNPCQTCNAEEQAKIVADLLKKNRYATKVWVDSDYLQLSDKKRNIEILDELTATLRIESYYPSLMATKALWEAHYGPAGDEFSQFELMYKSFNKEPNYKDFIKFGGWKEPKAKNYQAIDMVCGQEMSLIYFD